MTDRGLAARLSQALVAFTIEFDNEFEHQMPHRTATFGPDGTEPAVSPSGTPVRRPWLVSKAMWSNCMRFVGKDGMPLAALEHLPANLAGLERWGYIVVAPDQGHAGPLPPRSEWLVRPTVAGRWAQAIWRRLDGVVDKRWQERFGAELIGQLQETLRAVLGQDVLGQDGAALPLYLPMVTYDNGMKTKYGVGAGTRLPSPDTSGPGPSASTDLSALLSRVLLVFTTEYERGSALSLPIAANALRVLAADGSRMRDLPRLAGVSKEGASASVSFLQRHGYVVVGPDASGGRGKVVRPTPSGRLAQDEYPRVCGVIEERWQSLFGSEVIDSMRDCLRRIIDHRDGDQPTPSLGLQPYPEGWRAHGPYLAQTKAMLSDPGAALPHHPMVLHRGGFPDGS